MATNTYVALDTKTVTSAVSSVTFTSIPATYTDLVLVSNAILASGGAANLWCRFNGDTGGTTNYSTTYLAGNGSAASSSRDTSAAEGWCGRLSSSNWTTSIASFQNYSNNTTFKTSISRGNDTSGLVIAYASLWRQTNPISGITLTNSSGVNFSIGSTFTLYGIRAEGVSPAVKATGGAIYSDSTYYYHVFDATGTFTPNQALTADLLVVAGGGGGGGGSGTNGGGGGGAGGWRELLSQSLTSGTAYTCTVGAGGAGGNGVRGSVGGNSSISGTGFTTLTRTGGGGGGLNAASNKDGLTGGSGGGAGATSAIAGTGGTGNSGSYTPVEGYNGGNGSSNGTTYDAAGGGGGGGGNGQAASSTKCGDGGIGVTSSLINAIGTATGLGQLSSSNYYLAGGAGGGCANFVPAGTGGLGGGANGTVSTTANNGSICTGGGGGGGSNNANSAGRGGSGVVIVRYLKA